MVLRLQRRQHPERLEPAVVEIGLLGRDTQRSIRLGNLDVRLLLLRAKRRVTKTAYFPPLIAGMDEKIRTCVIADVERPSGTRAELAADDISTLAPGRAKSPRGSPPWLSDSQ